MCRVLNLNIHGTRTDAILYSRSLDVSELDLKLQFKFSPEKFDNNVHSTVGLRFRTSNFTKPTIIQNEFESFGVQIFVLVHCGTQIRTGLQILLENERDDKHHTIGIIIGETDPVQFWRSTHIEIVSGKVRKIESSRWNNKVINRKHFIKLELRTKVEVERFLRTALKSSKKEI